MATSPNRLLQVCAHICESGYEKAPGETAWVYVCLLERVSECVPLMSLVLGQYSETSGQVIFLAPSSSTVFDLLISKRYNLIVT